MTDPRLKLLYLVAVGLLAFLASSPAVLAILLGGQIALWCLARLPLAMLVDASRRLAGFLAFVLVSYAFFAGEAGDRIHWIPVPGLGLSLPVNLTGLVKGLLLSTRIITLVLASAIIRHTGPGNDLVRGLRMLRVPLLVGVSVDLVLASLGPQRRGRGDGTGRARGPEPPSGPEPGREEASRTLALRILLRGDVSPLVRLVERHIARAREHAAGYAVSPVVAGDAAVLGGLAVLAMTLRFLKFMPGIPVAPGHKGVVLIPLYILANRLTASRWGATAFGAILGLTGLFFGVGKLGPFEALRHLLPGLFVDLVVPAVTAVIRSPRAWLWGLVGAGTALMRLSTVVGAAAFVEVPPAFYVMMLPMLLTNTLFGFLSGFVTAQLMGVAHRFRASPAAAPEPVLVGVAVVEPEGTARRSP